MHFLNVIELSASLLIAACQVRLIVDIPPPPPLPLAPLRIQPADRQVPCFWMSEQLQGKSVGRVFICWE